MLCNIHDTMNDTPNIILYIYTYMYIYIVNILQPDGSQQFEMVKNDQT